MTPSDESRPERLDPRALDATWARLAAAPSSPWLHAEIARRMGDRLAIVRLVPEVVLDWWGELGASGDLLAQAYPDSRVVRILRPVTATRDDVRSLPAMAASSSPETPTPTPTPTLAPAPAPAPAQTSSPSFVSSLPVSSPAPALRAQSKVPAAVPAWRRWLGLAPTPASTLAQAEVAAGRAQLVWANMGVQWADDAPALMRAWHGALAVDGFLMFSTLGPGTLRSLRDLFARSGWGAAYPPWTDMHDLGDMLVDAGFADPVMDQEMLRLTWSTPEAALAELRGLGANVDRKRFAGLRTPRWQARLLAGLQSLADAQGRVMLEFEIVYGHAFKPLPRLRVGAETAVDLDDMKARLRRRTR